MIQPKKATRLLVIDDEVNIRQLLLQELQAYGFEVITAASGEEALETLSREKFDAAICDVKMPQMDGLTALGQMKTKDPSMEVIMITGYGTIETAVDAIKAGAFDFVIKPFETKQLVKKIEQAMEKNELKTLTALYEASRLLFTSLKMDDVLKESINIISRVLGADEASIFILTEDHKLTLTAVTGSSRKLEPGYQMQVGERIAGRAVELKKEYLINGSLEEHPDFRHLKSNPDVKSSIVAPMIVNNEPVGVLCLNRNDSAKPFSETSLRNAVIFAAQIGQAIANAKLYKEVRIHAAEAQAAHEQLGHIQDQLLQSEKLASLGRLVAGIAHEINNPMTAILGFSQLVLEQNRESGFAPQMEIIYQEADRCRRIIKDLLAFARKRKPEKKNMNLSDTVARAVFACQNQIKDSGANVDVQQLPKELIISGDFEQLEDVIRNLIINACHALSRAQGEKVIKVFCEETAAHLNLKIQDTGAGIPENDIKKIFDPFFSTKGVGGGTGLGLSLAYGVVQEHGGLLLVESQEGAGTTFTVQLPKNVEQMPPVKAEPKKILIVEDEPAIMMFMKSLLDPRVYQCDAAANGLEGLKKIQDKIYDLVICDFRMPRMNGKMLFEKTKEIQQDTMPRFLFITGFADDDEDGDFLKRNNLQYLLKPFTRDAFLAMVEDHCRSLA